MGKYALLALAIMVAISLSAIIIPDSDGESDEFTEGPFTFSTIEDGVAIIEYSTESQVEDLRIPSTVEHEGKTYKVTMNLAMFSNESIKTVFIPKSLVHTTIPCFYGPNIKEISVEEGNPTYSSLDGVLFDKDFRTLYEFPNGLSDTPYHVPEKVSVIGDGAFEDSNISEIYLNEGLGLIGAYSFSGCSNLSKIISDNGENTLPTSVYTIDTWAFRNCRMLENLVLQYNVVALGAFAFSGSGITEMSIPYSLMAIGDGAFADCPNLKGFSSDNETFLEIDGVLYQGRSSFTLVSYPAGKTDSVYRILDSTVDITPYAFSGCDHLKQIVLPKSITVVSQSAFAECRSLERINLDHVIVFDTNSFYGCTSLTTIDFGSQAAYIGPAAFANTGITEITIPKSVYNICMSSFMNNPELTTVTILEDTECEIESKAFYRCFNLKDIVFYSKDVHLNTGALDIGSLEQHAEVNLSVVKGYNVNSEAVTDDYTELSITVQGERPYPYENLIGVAICLLILYLIVRIFRGV